MVTRVSQLKYAESSANTEFKKGYEAYQERLKETPAPVPVKKTPAPKKKKVTCAAELFPQAPGTLITSSPIPLLRAENNSFPALNLSDSQIDEGASSEPQIERDEAPSESDSQIDEGEEELQKEMMEVSIKVWKEKIQAFQNIFFKTVSDHSLPNRVRMDITKESKIVMANEPQIERGEAPSESVMHILQKYNV